MTASASITPQTAPRDVNGLKGMGIFQLRTLIERLGALQTDEQKMAFSGMSMDQKANLALEFLSAWDKAHPGQAAVAPPHANGVAAPAMSAPTGMMSAPSMPLVGTVAAMPGQPQFGQPGAAPAFNGFNTHPPQPQAPQAAPQFQAPPMAQQPMFAPPPQVAAVDPGALAAAQNAVSTAPAASGRKPRNSTTKEDAAPADPALAEKLLGLLSTIGQQQQLLAQQSQANTEAVASAVREVSTALQELKKENVKEQLTGLQNAYAGVYNALVSMDGRLTAIQNSTNLTIALSLMLAEQVINGASRQDILSAGMSDVSSIAQILAPQAAPGKA